MFSIIARNEMMKHFYKSSLKEKKKITFNSQENTQLEIASGGNKDGATVVRTSLRSLTCNARDDNFSFQDAITVTKIVGYTSKSS